MNEITITLSGASRETLKTMGTFIAQALYVDREDRIAPRSLWRRLWDARLPDKPTFSETVTVSFVFDYPVGVSAQAPSPPPR